MFLLTASLGGFWLIVFLDYGFRNYWVNCLKHPKGPKIFENRFSSFFFLERVLFPTSFVGYIRLGC